MSLIDISLKIIVGLLLLLVVTKILGKTQINQVTPFDFISALVLGEILGNAIYDQKVELFYVLYTLFLWGFFMYIIELINQKILKMRSLLEGRPSIIIDKGKIIREELRKNKINLNTLQQLLRENNIFSVREVEYAILETSGRLSVLKKSNYDIPTKEDMDLTYKPVYLPVTLISEGEILQENLKNSGYDKFWLESKLKEQNIYNFEKVFYAEWKEDEGLYVEEYD